ncbi:MAG: tRNA adenosine(34) deaminase TadA [Myxococcota bacterium]|nr:tRNA adenosine(34) deaminase TadA [Myxococcota bacterium]
MNTDEPFMRQAIELAQAAAEMGEVPVAALVVKDGEVIAQAHNRREVDQDPCAHAELLAIRKAADVLGSWRLEGCTIYVTLEPCPMCAGAMWLSRIEACVFGCFDPKAGFMGSVADINQFEKLNHHFPVRGGVLEEECATLLRTFFRRIRSRKLQKRD